MGAYLIDLVIVAIIQALLFPLMSRGAVLSGGAVDPSAMAMLYGVSFALGIGYVCGFETVRGATPGKMALGIKILKTNGSPIGFGTSLGRLLLKGVFSGLTCLLAYIAVATNPVHQGWHDKLMNTMVVKSR